MNNIFTEQLQSSLPLSYEIRDHFYDRSLVSNDFDKMYLFGENLDFTSGNNLIGNVDYEPQSKIYSGKKYPIKSQAVIRGLFNAFPIITKKGEKKNELFDSTQEDYELFKESNERCIGSILQYSNQFDCVVIPAGGFASGRARLPIAQAKYLCFMLNQLFKPNRVQANTADIINGKYEEIKYVEFSWKWDLYGTPSGIQNEDWFKITVDELTLKARIDD